MGIDHLIFGALMVIVVLLLYAAHYLWHIATTLKVLEERSRPRQCRVCGCTDEFGCSDEPFGSCYWVAEDLCSRCSSEERQRFDADVAEARAWRVEP